MTLYGLRSTRGCETGDYRVTQQIVFRGALARPRDRFKRQLLLDTRPHEWRDTNPSGWQKLSGFAER